MGEAGGEAGGEVGSKLLRSPSRLFQSYGNP
jgi:hypothetical protein